MQMEEDNGTRTLNGNGIHILEKETMHDLTLYTILNRLIAAIVFPGSDSSVPLLQRIKGSLSENVPLLCDASRNTVSSVILWTRRGSPLRALLVVSVGAIVSITLAGLLVFILFFVAATVNAVIISLLISLAAAGGFLAIFFACVAAIYVGALSVAVFVISTALFWCTVAVLITTGWIGFFWTMWIATQKSVGLAKHSVYMTGSALSAYSSARRNRGTNKSH